MSPKSPRNVSGRDLIKALTKLGYQTTRQKGSHIRLSHSSANGTHHITVPDHDPLKLSTFSAIVTDVAEHLKIDRSIVLDLL